MHKISKRHDALKLVTEISPTLINSRLVLDIWISDTRTPTLKHLDNNNKIV